MLRSRLRLPRCRCGAPAAAQIPPAGRLLHGLPSLSHDFSKGIPGFMSRDGFDIAWTQNMTLLLDKLNAMTAGTELEDQDAKNILLMTAREPKQAPIFNYASMAHNNHFFFQGITPTTKAIPQALRAELDACFSSLETLKLEFIYTAAAMFGPGFLWLVHAGASDYRILTTYLAGSPYSGAHWRAQPVDENTRGADGSSARFFEKQLRGSPRRDKTLPPGGIDVQPILCLSTWEHAWLPTWGTGVGGKGGKIEYVQRWWDRIDWDVVTSRSGVMRPGYKSATT